MVQLIEKFKLDKKWLHVPTNSENASFLYPRAVRVLPGTEVAVLAGVTTVANKALDRRGMCLGHVARLLEY